MNELGDSYRRLDQTELACATLEKSLKTCEEVARSHPANGYHQHLVADVAYSLASLHYHERHDPAQARGFFQKTLDIELELTTTYPAVGEYLFYMNNLIRDLRDWYGDQPGLEAVIKHFTVAINDYEARYSPEKRDPLHSANYYFFRGEAQFLLARYAKALADFKRCGSDQAAGAAALIDAQHGSYESIFQAAMTNAKNDSGNGAECYRAAQLVATAIAISRDDRSLSSEARQELAEKLGSQAVEWLRKARSLNYLSTPSTRYLLADDRDLEPLRSRDDFRALVAQTGKVPPAAK